MVLHGKRVLVLTEVLYLSMQGESSGLSDR